MALGTVFLLNAAALVVFPVLGRTFGLDEHQFGLWAALAIHDTSSVVGAAMQFGPQALATATTVKLARALWIIPLAFLLARRHARRSAASVKKPWFILGFVAAAALATFVPELTEPGRAVAGVARYGMVLTLFLIGANLTPKALKEVGPRPLLQGFALWVLVSCGTLAGVVEGWIR